MYQLADETDVGKITDIQSHANGYNVVIKEDGADYEIGFPVYREDLGGWFPCKGDEVEIVGLSEGLITKLKINGKFIFERTLKQAAIWKEIRQIETRARQLRELLKNES